MIPVGRVHDCGCALIRAPASLAQEARLVPADRARESRVSGVIRGTEGV
jgi:hypothetical protein